jgi:hypothetical protein
LRAGDGGLPLQGFAQDLFAFGQPGEIPAGADDLRGASEMAVEIGDDGWLGLDCLPFPGNIIAVRIARGNNRSNNQTSARMRSAHRYFAVRPARGRDAARSHRDGSTIAPPLKAPMRS